MTAVRRKDALTFAGPPRDVRAAWSHDPAAGRVVPVTVRLEAGPAVLRGVVRGRGSDTPEIRLRLPEDTPPGTYHGDVVLGDEKRPVVVDVAPVLWVHVEPSEARVEAEAGGRAEFTVAVFNRGNVAVEIEKARTLDLDEEDQDRALGRALRADLDGDERRVDRFFEELRASHGGEGRVTVVRGAGRLGPGESRDLHCRLDVPMSAEPGRTYFGGWTVGDAGHLLMVTVLKAPSGTPRTRKRKAT